MEQRVLVAGEVGRGGISVEQRRVLAVAAILNERNGHDHMRIGGVGRPSGTPQATFALAKWWGVRTEGEAVAMLEWLEKEGHRGQVAGKGAVGAKGAVAKDLVAWDLVRMAGLAGQAFAARLLSREVAWGWMKRAAVVLMDEVGSFAEAAQGYLRGLRAWAGEGSDAVASAEAAIARLNGAEEGPFRLAWDMDVSWVGAPDERVREVLVHPGDSLTEAMRAAGVDGRVVFAPGEYEWSLVPPHPVELVAEHAGKVVLVKARGEVLRVNRGVTVVVRGLTLQGGLTVGAKPLDAVQVDGGFVILEDCEVTGPHHGVTVMGGGDARLVRSVVRDVGVTGVVADPGDVVLSGVEIRSPGRYGVFFSGGNDRCLMEDVTVSGAGEVGMFLAGQVTARRCRVSGGAAYGLVAARGGVVEVARSVVEGTRQRAVFVQEGATLLMEDSEVAGADGAHVDVREGLAALSRTKIHGPAKVGVWVQAAGRVDLHRCRVALAGKRMALFASSGAKMMVLGCDLAAGSGIVSHGARGWVSSSRIAAKEGHGVDVAAGDDLVVMDCEVAAKEAGIVVRAGARARVSRCSTSECGLAGLEVEEGGSLVVEDGDLDAAGEGDAGGAGGAIEGALVVRGAPAVQVALSPMREGSAWSFQVGPCSAWEPVFAPRGDVPTPLSIGRALVMAAGVRARVVLGPRGEVLFQARSKEEIEKLYAFAQLVVESPGDLRELYDHLAATEFAEELRAPG